MTTAAPPARRASAAEVMGSKWVSAALLEALASRVTVADGDHGELEVENPARGELLATVPRCRSDDVSVAVERGRDAQRRWRETSLANRRAILLRFHDLILNRQDEVLDLLQLESGKARRHGFEETSRSWRVTMRALRSGTFALPGAAARSRFSPRHGSTIIRSAWSG